MNEKFPALIVSGILLMISTWVTCGSVRTELIRYILKADALPPVYPAVEENVIVSEWQDMPNLHDITRLTITNHGIKSTMLYFYPLRHNGEMVLYHQGHRGNFILGKKTIARFLKEGYSVIGISMPPKPHSKLKKMESGTFCPISLFVLPVIAAINFSCRENVAMIGISGGGWTTVLCAALDARITKSFSVSGSLPLRYKSPRDYEQTDKKLYEIAGYEDLYVLAANNGLHVQCVNIKDPCCFSGYHYREYHKRVSEMTNGKFEVIADSTHREHKISNNVLDYVLHEGMATN